MFNLPSIAKLCVDSKSVIKNCALMIDYKKNKTQAQAQADFDENIFNGQYSKAHGIHIEDLANLENISKQNFSFISQGLGSYELAHINSSLGSYSCAQKKIKKTINYFESNLDSVLSTDNANFDKTTAKIIELSTNVKEALNDYIKRFKKDYDNLTINDFKGKNVSDELAMQRYASYISNTFLNSNQAKEENKKAANKLNDGLKSTKKKIQTYEERKKKINAKTSIGLYDSNHSIAQVDEMLGEGYNNKKNWEKDLTPYFENGLLSLITAASQ